MTEQRNWTLRATGDRPLTVNRVAVMHRQQWARATRDTREQWGWIARAARIPKLDRCVIEATPLHADGRSPQDVGACAPAVKAAIDGIVDAGVLDDDDPGRVLYIGFRPPKIGEVDGLELAITRVDLGDAETCPVVYAVLPLPAAFR